MTTTQRLMQAVAPIWTPTTPTPLCWVSRTGPCPGEVPLLYPAGLPLSAGLFQSICHRRGQGKKPENDRLFAQYIPVMDGELDIHSGYLAKLNVTQQELDQTPGLWTASPIHLICCASPMKRAKPRL